MKQAFSICLAQINLTVGAIDNNRDRIIEFIAQAREHDADVIVFPELALSGYPPEDLLLRPGFIRQTNKCLQEIVDHCREITVLLGYPMHDGEALYNACAIIQNGRLVTSVMKQILPNYGVFDEKRYFSSGDKTCVIDLFGTATAVTICEDLWEESPCRMAREAGAGLLININASPFHIEKLAQRREIITRRARDNHLDIIYVNMVGGQDELVFDGGSLIIDNAGEKLFQADEFREDLYYATYDPDARVRFNVESPPAELLPRLDNLYSALVLGIRDYVTKNGFNGAVIGLSGGIDSALALCLAVDALGRDNVESVLMPSPYTAPMSTEDAVEQSMNLGVVHTIIPIETLYRGFLEALSPIFADRPQDTTEENIQARCRGTLLMAISNKSGKLVLATGNKSEMSVGYATLYGDMAGGFAPLKDVKKTLVFELSHWCNRERIIIPERVLTRPPSAELKADQRDDDSLPPYDILDPILEAYIELGQSPDEIIRRGFDHDTVIQVIRMVDKNEYKRRQAAPGVRITRRAFGRDWRYPITSGYRES